MSLSLWSWSRVFTLSHARVMLIISFLSHLLPSLQYTIISFITGPRRFRPSSVQDACYMLECFFETRPALPRFIRQNENRNYQLAGAYSKWKLHLTPSKLSINIRTLPPQHCRVLIKMNIRFECKVLRLSKVFSIGIFIAIVPRLH